MLTIDDIQFRLSVMFMDLATAHIPEQAFTSIDDLSIADYNYLVGCAERAGLVDIDSVDQPPFLTNKGLKYIQQLFMF